MERVRHSRFIVYILKCSDGSLYSGYTNDLDKRLKCHNQGKGAKYTRGRLPTELVWHEDYKYLRCAMQKEIKLKKPSRKQKERLIMKYQKSKTSESAKALNMSAAKVYIKTFD